MGEQLLREALSQDPDNKEAANTLRLLKVSAKKKEEASASFSKQDYKTAIQQFDECVALDPLNLTYNSTLLHNKAIAFSKLGDHSQALKALNQCIKANPRYAKALIRRGDLKCDMKMYDEAVSDFANAKEIDPTAKDIEQKLKYAQA